MSKKIRELLERVDNLGSLKLKGTIKTGELQEYHVKEQWFSDKRSPIPNANCSGGACQ